MPGSRHPHGNGMKRIITGILAHVDAGKTTLSEALLYEAGKLRAPGRVDRGDAFLDTYALEKERGITIFSKQAELEADGTAITLLDTPGHVDFSAETERTLQVLDAAILVISGTDGVQGHTLTLWKLLEKHRIPVFLFVNKMDQPGADRDSRMAELKKTLSDGCTDFTHPESEETQESAALCEEALMDRYLQTGRLDDSVLTRLIAERKLFPCWFGSALRLIGVKELLAGLSRFTAPRKYPKPFGARVYKITRDGAGNRLTFLKVTGGSLKPRATLTYEAGGNEYSEKITQIRQYSGEKYESLPEAEAGMVCAVTGLSSTYPGEGLGTEPAGMLPTLQPVLSYSIQLPEGVSASEVLPKLRQLEEEIPEIGISWEETLQEIHVQIMGEVQLEILQSLISDRFGLNVTFGDGKIVYRETIANTVEGVGHFEPLRHYAEVHLLLEPGEPSSGMVFATNCSEDILAGNWQRLVLTHLAEKRHRGVLTGSELTDMKITLINGRAHVKHTEGGDFRQATYRAVRQGLMQAESVLLEPWYSFRLTVPVELVGRAMTDIQNRSGIPNAPETDGTLSVLTGVAPVSSFRNYQTEVAAYTHGRGHMTLTFDGYRPCHNTEEVIAETGYDPDSDLRNPSASVFCTHGSSFTVPWNEVRNYMHLEGWEGASAAPQEEQQEEPESEPELWIGTDEIDAILAKTYYANGKDRSLERRGVGRREFSRAKDDGPVKRTFTPRERLPEYLLVDGYNILFAWDELSELLKQNADAARQRLLDILSDYQGATGKEIIVVFDAYRIQGHQTETADYLNIHYVFTKEAETADQYIEKFTHRNAGRYHITVATSDGLEQIIIRGAGSELMSARDLHAEVQRMRQASRETLESRKENDRRYLLDEMIEEDRRKLTEGQEDTDSGKEKED